MEKEGERCRRGGVGKSGEGEGTWWRRERRKVETHAWMDC